MTRPYPSKLKMLVQVLLFTSVVGLLCHITLKPVRLDANQNRGVLLLHRSQQARSILDLALPAGRRTAAQGDLLALSFKVADTRDWSLHGYRVAGINIEMDGDYLWMDDHTILFMRHVTPAYTTKRWSAPLRYRDPEQSYSHAQFYALDIRTGQERTLTALSQLFKETDGNPAWVRLSPDGTWLLWSSFYEDQLASNKQQLCVATIEGTSLRTFPTIAENAYWLQNSHQFLGLNMSDGKVDSIDRFDVKGSIEGTSLPYGFSISEIVVAGLGMLPDDRLIVVASPEFHNITLVDFSSSEFLGIPLVDPLKPVKEPAYQDFRYSLPKGWELYLPSNFQQSVYHSPTGDRIAWLLRRPGPEKDSQRWGLWISNHKGEKMRLLGTVTVKNTTAPKSEFSRVRWHPGGKHLSFIYKDALYVTPVD